MPNPNGVGMGGEHDGDGLARLTSGLGFGRGRRKDEVDIHAGQLGRVLGHLRDAIRPAEFDGNIPAFDISEVP